MVGWLSPDSIDLDLVVFTKDGTLLDFEATWISGYRECAERVSIAAGEPALAPALLKAGGLNTTDDGSIVIMTSSVVRQGSLREVAQHWVDTQPMIAAHWHGAFERLLELMEETLLEATTRDVTPLGQAAEGLQRLRDAGIQLALVTSDTERITRSQLRRLGWEGYFAPILTAESGYDDMPSGAAVSAAITESGCEPQRTVLVGGAARDVDAGLAAGCLFTVAVFPESKQLPAMLAGATCRVSDVGGLPTLLTDAGVRRLMAPLPSTCGEYWRFDPAVGEEAALAEEERASQRESLMSEIDPAIVSIVDAMMPVHQF